MSGPKTSHYRLTPEQRRALQEQLRRQREEALRQRTIAALRQEITELRKQIGGETAQLRSVDRKLAQLGAEPRTAALRQEAEALLQKTASVPEQELETARNALRTLRNRVEFAGKSEETLKKTVESGKKQEIGAAIDRAFRGSGEKAPTKLEQAILELESLTLPDELQQRAEALRMQAEAIHSEEFRDHFYAVTVLPLLKEARLWQEKGREYEDLFAQYRLLCEELGIEEESIIFSETAADILQVRIARLETEALRLREQAVIRQCIDETMEEMGYRVVGSRSATGVLFNRLYRFGEGTAVCITGTDDGQITMELGGVDREDRLPTDVEVDCLVGEMQDFCGRYGELEQRLREKGILTTRLSVLPPKAEYAQIINVTPFDLTDDTACMQIQNIRKTSEIKQIREVF